MSAAKSVLSSYSEATKHCKQIKAEADKVSNEFNSMFNLECPVRIEVEVAEFELGYGVISCIYFGDAKLREYDIAELAILDLNRMMINKLRHTLGESLNNV